MSLRNMTSHSPESIDRLLSDPKETPPKFGTHALLLQEPFPYHCQKRRMAIYGACFHTKPMLASLRILSASCSSSALFTQPSPLTRTLALLSPTLLSLTTCSQLPSGAFSPPLRSCPCLYPCLCRWSLLFKSCCFLMPSWDSIILGSSHA